MDVSYGGNGFSNYEYMPINLHSGSNETSVSLYVPVCLSGTVTNFADGWLEIYDEWNNYCTGTYVGSDGSFAVYHVKAGT
jgi:hypothetical protein